MRRQLTRVMCVEPPYLRGFVSSWFIRSFQLTARLMYDFDDVPNGRSFLGTSSEILHSDAVNLTWIRTVSAITLRKARDI